MSVILKKSMAVVSMIGLSYLFAVPPCRGAGARQQRVFHVSPDGSDRNPGTRARPFKTIEKARDEVRAINGDMSGDIIVYLRAGHYEISRTIRFDQRDSGTNDYNVVYKAYPAEKPIVSGGTRITGWQPAGEGRWRAQTDVHNFRTTNSDMADWRNRSDIELGYYVVWSHMICPVESIARDEAGGAIVTMRQPCYYIARHKEGVQAGLPDYAENAFELLDEPGEWYLDRSEGVVYYFPRPGERLDECEVIAPVVETLLELKGTLDEPIHHIRFEGITFAHAGWLRPSELGHADYQANFVVLDPTTLYERGGTVVPIHNEATKSPANIVLDAAKSVVFERCVFTHLGGAGVDLQHGPQDNAICGCEFYDISGSAIQVGDVLRDDHHPEDERLIVRGNRIVNNYIHDIGVEYQDSIGVFVGYTDGTVIAHNEICSLPYSGISVGWGWGEEDAGGGNYPLPFYYDAPTPSSNNRIEYNHIHHVLLQRTDGGGIYTLGNQLGTIIARNHIHDNVGVPGGIYLDEGSGYIEVTGNAVYNVNRAMNYNNHAQDRIATCSEHDNYFDVAPTDTEAARDVAEQAGLERGYRDLLRSD